MNVVISVLLCTLVAVPAWSEGIREDQMDIAGIRIGMTEAEVRAALASFDPQLEIADIWAAFNYSDGVNHVLKSPEFLDRLEAHQASQGATIRVYFSGPNEDVLAIGVGRSALMSNPPTSTQFMESLVAKYGPPSGFSRTGTSQPVWEGRSKVSCVRGRDYQDNVVIDLSAGLGESLLANAATEDYLIKRSASNTGRGLIPSDPTICGVYLSYYFVGDPVREFQAEMYDLGAMVATERSRSAWVDQLQSQAIQKRQAQGEAPRL